MDIIYTCWLLRLELKHPSNSIFISLVTLLGVSGGHLVQRQFSLGGCLCEELHSYHDKDFFYLFLWEGKAGAAEERRRKQSQRGEAAIAFGTHQGTLAGVHGLGEALLGPALVSLLWTHMEVNCCSEFRS